MTSTSSAGRRDQDPCTLQELRVLLVEDHDAQRSLLRRMLNRLGVKTVREASCGREAIACLQEPEAQFDLLITDLRMPEGDGLDVIAAVTEDIAVGQIVLLTAVDDDVVAALHRLPAQVHGSRLLTVSKPISLRQLEDICRNAAQRLLPYIQERIPWTRLEIEQALQAREFHGYLEPQVDLRRGTVIGFEVLARWEHPLRGVLPPSDFLVDVEHVGLMRELSLAMLESALNSLCSLRAAGYQGGISLNIAASCLERSQFPAEAAAMVLRAGETCDQITLELTETDEIQDSVLEISNLARLRLEGFHLAADDFGLGYSSLAKLQRGAFDEIKIDREFSAGAHSDRIGRAAVGSILALARNLGATCVAEGVETEATRQLLVQLGCEAGQGYLFSKPLPPEQVVGWWRQWAPASEMAAVASAPLLDVAPATLDSRSLERLARRDLPAWIFDLDRLCMVWANAAGLEFWRAETLAELQARDMKSDMSISARLRLDTYREQLRDGKPQCDRWTLYPKGVPATVDCVISGLYTLSGRCSMLVEASPVGVLQTQEHYLAESARSAAVSILVANTGGDILWQNPCSVHTLGLGMRHCADFLGGHPAARSAIDSAVSQGQAVVESTFLHGECPRAVRVVLRRSRNVSDGQPMVVLTLFDLATT